MDRRYSSLTLIDSDSDWLTVYWPNNTGWPIGIYFFIGNNDRAEQTTKCE